MVATQLFGTALDSRAYLPRAAARVSPGVWTAWDSEGGITNVDNFSYASGEGTPADADSSLSAQS